MLDICEWLHTRVRVRTHARTHTVLVVCSYQKAYMSTSIKRMHVFLNMLLLHISVYVSLLCMFCEHSYRWNIFTWGQPKLKLKIFFMMTKGESLWVIMHKQSFEQHSITSQYFLTYIETSKSCLFSHSFYPMHILIIKLWF